MRLGLVSSKLNFLAIVGIAGVLTALPAHAQSMDDAWQSVLRRWTGNGWKPFHALGYNFTTDGREGKRWGAGLKAGAPVTFAAVCGNCAGVQLILRDGAGSIVATANPQQGSTSLTYTPKASSNGSIQLIPTACRLTTCPVRYTSFAR